ncbi:MAG: NAD(P)/FAD-dependent oxidoreductase, partial [Candidatus Zixiibacteriota bacterium]
MSENHHKVVIIGSGPAGFTAAIYAGRANLNPVIFEGMQPGGQLTITTEVDNYPGFEKGIMGPELMEIMRKQAQRFGAETIFSEITEVDFSQRPFKLKSYKDEYTADSVIIATGASARLLGLESEKEYM